MKTLITITILALIFALSLFPREEWHVEGESDLLPQEMAYQEAMEYGADCIINARTGEKVYTGEN